MVRPVKTEQEGPALLLLRTARPRQWTKNLLVFAAPGAAGVLSHGHDVVRALGAEVQAAIHLDVPREELIGRLLARGRGSEDTQAVIEHRLQVYQENTLPLLEYYAGREWMFTVNGDRPTDTVHEDIVGRIQKLASFIESTG